jgi:hypothetical protein
LLTQKLELMNKIRKEVAETEREGLLNQIGMHFIIEDKKIKVKKIEVIEKEKDNWEAIVIGEVYYPAKEEEPFKCSAKEFLSKAKPIK